MSYVVCRSCKKYVKVNENIPLNFDKCDNCGHKLEFAGSDNELNMVLHDVKLPEISYNKVCADCHSLNPRETGACLHCGSTNLRFQYNMDSLKDFQNVNSSVDGGDVNQQPQTIIIRANPNFSPKNSILFRIFSLIIGLIDFFFFSLVGIELMFGTSQIPADVMGFVSQNIVSLSLIIAIALMLAGLMSVMIIPRMSYKDSVETSSTIGVVVGLFTLMVSKDLISIIISILICTVLTSIGGLIGEYIIHKLTHS